MHSEDYRYTAPQPVIVRAAPLKRMKRIRIAWFILGALLGGSIAYYASTVIHAVEFSERFDATPHLYARINSQPHPPATLVASASPPPTVIQTVTATPVAASIPATSRQALPANISIAVQEGDTLMSMLMDRGIGYNEARSVMQSMKKVYNPKNLNVGQLLELHLDKSGNDSAKPIVSNLSIAISPLKTITLNRSENNSFTTKEIKAPVYKSLAHASGIISSSLYQTGIDAGMPAQMISEVIHALSYDVDFQRDIKEGDRLDVIYERMRTDKNVTAGYGNVLYASLTIGDRKVAIFHHESKDGYSGYYNSFGESVKKALLRTPVNGAHITSGFGWRIHPLLGYSKMHKGIDFGAVIGTPIYAAGDGVIEEAGYKGTYGNYVRIRHNNHYETAYAHANRIARGIYPGVHVKQGQVVAYVGSTGRSTGPHLHYEILVNGSQVNPANVKFRTGQTLQGHELAEFKHQIQQVESVLATVPAGSSVQVASLK